MIESLWFDGDQIFKTAQKFSVELQKKQFFDKKMQENGCYLKISLFLLRNTKTKKCKDTKKSIVFGMGKCYNPIS